MSRHHDPGSVKTDRILERLGVVRELADGAPFVLVGPTYEMRNDPNVRVRLVFERDDEARVCVGYASNESGDWKIVETEPFSRVAHDYWERRLKRIGDYVAVAKPKR